jgi:deoxyribonuclease-4
MADRTAHRDPDRRAGRTEDRRAGLPLIGAQISTAGGFGAVPERAIAIGAETVQIFSSNPRMWPTKSPDPRELAALAASLGELHLPLFFHTIYLINLASADEQHQRRSSQSLSHALVTGALAGAAGVVTHVGSHGGAGFDNVLPRVVEAVQTAKETARVPLVEMGHESPLPPLLLETGAGAGTIVGSRLEELAALVAALAPRSGQTRPEPVGTEPVEPHPYASRRLEVGLCLDTAHMFAAGYPLHEAEGLDEMVAELSTMGILNETGLIHLNDSSAPFASNRDRHENPGDGQIGYDGLARVVRHPALAGIPFVLEVPGTNGHGPEAAEVELVKSMRAGAPSPRGGPAPGA